MKSTTAAILLLALCRCAPHTLACTYFSTDEFRAKAPTYRTSAAPEQCRAEVHGYANRDTRLGMIDANGGLCGYAYFIAKYYCSKKCSELCTDSNDKMMAYVRCNPFVKLDDEGATADQVAFSCKCKYLGVVGFCEVPETTWDVVENEYETSCLADTTTSATSTTSTTTSSTSTAEVWETLNGLMGSARVTTVNVTMAQCETNCAEHMGDEGTYTAGPCKSYVFFQPIGTEPYGICTVQAVSRFDDLDGFDSHDGPHSGPGNSDGPMGNMEGTYTYVGLCNGDMALCGVQPEVEEYDYGGGDMPGMGGYGYEYNYDPYQYSPP